MIYKNIVFTNIDLSTMDIWEEIVKNILIKNEIGKYIIQPSK
jgi:hypothetical protein